VPLTVAARVEGLRFAYIGNVPGLADAGTTWCPGCKKPIIERDIHAITAASVVRKSTRFFSGRSLYPLASCACIAGPNGISRLRAVLI
jgi:hypothetical protein